MRRRLTFLSLILGWLCANGAVWDAAQVLAWGKMFSENARVLGLSQAWSATFDPARACEICGWVQEGKAAREATSPPADTATGAGKFQLALPRVCAAASPAPETAAIDRFGPTGPERPPSGPAPAVPTPPPRSAAPV